MRLSGKTKVFWELNDEVGYTVSLFGFILYPSILSRLRYPTLLQLALSLLSPIQPYQLWRAKLFWHVPYFIPGIVISTFSRLLCLSGYIPISALNIAILVVFENSSTFLAAAICTVSSCFWPTSRSLPILVLHVPALVHRIHQNTYFKYFNPGVKV